MINQQPCLQAARIEGQAEGGQILICETTHQHCFGAGARRLTKALHNSSSFSSVGGGGDSAVHSPFFDGGHHDDNLKNDYSGDAAAADAAAFAAAAAIGEAMGQQQEGYYAQSDHEGATGSMYGGSSGGGGGGLFSRSASMHDPTLHAHLAPSGNLAEATVVKDLGVRALKGIARPEHIYEVGR